MSDRSTPILFIEDDSQDVVLVDILLAKATDFPAHLETVETLEAALERLEQGGIDLVLCDLSLPDEQGLDTFRQLHAHFPQVPIVILSGLNDEQLALTAMQEGAQDYLVKGKLDQNLLVRTIRYGLERHRLRLKVQQQTSELQTSKARLHTIISNIADGIVIVNRNGRILFVNPAAESLLDRARDELVGDVFGFPLMVEERTEIQIQRRSGKVAIAEMRLVEIDWDGEVAYLASLRDISDRKWTELALAQLNDTLETRVGERTAELAKANQQLQELGADLRKALDKEKELSAMKSRIISTVSHEYRTPLMTILSSAELLERKRHRFDENKHLKHFQRIRSTVKHMTALVDDVLFLNKAESASIQFNPVPLDLVNFVRELIEEMRSSLTNKERLNLIANSNNLSANLDPKLLRQMLSNLISNAIKYSPDEGEVRVRIMWEERWVLFQVEDEGIGIPDEDKNKLFDSFSRASNVGAISGTGLGLSIVKTCANLHNGRISFESEVGVGSIFTISLPLLK